MEGAQNEAADRLDAWIAKLVQRRHERAKGTDIIWNLLMRNVAEFHAMSFAAVTPKLEIGLERASRSRR